jgi:glycosyltransferase involved in cell wall biosynthesis
MKIVVLDINYPSETNLYGDGFVHARVAGYVSRGHEVEVLAFFSREASYSFEGIRVTTVSNLEELHAAIARCNPDVIGIHFFQGWMLAKLIKRVAVPVVVWIHGIEAQAWYRRLCDFQFRPAYARYIAFNVLQLLRLRKLFAYQARNPGKAGIVFVSEWIRRVATTDTLRSIRRYRVIPNPINVNFFTFHLKDASQRRKVLLIRPFNSRVYANDQAVEAIVMLSAHAEFDTFSFTIVGSGRRFRDETRSLRQFANVTLHERFMSHEEIRKFHATHGVFLCPARSETQGVSRCEAMASGLVPVTSNNSAIPEFVRNGETGFLCASPSDMTSALLLLGSDQKLFARMSREAARSIRETVACDIIVPKELELMQELTTT